MASDKFLGLPPVVLATPAPITHRTAEENLGLGYLAAVLRRVGMSVLIIDGWLEGLQSDQIAQRICAIEPPLWIGFSCYRSNMQGAIEVAASLRGRGLKSPIVAGGYGPTFHPNDFLASGFDVVVRGDGEGSAVDLTRYFAFGMPQLREIPGIAFRVGEEIVLTDKRPALRDLDQLPFPCRDTLPISISRRSAVHIDSSRGCAAHCLFCSIVAFARISAGARWRQRSIKHFVDELEGLTNQGAHFFKVIDDSLIEPPRDKNWCTTLADEIVSRRLNVRLRGSIRADRVSDEIIAELKRAGFFAFSCGIENFSKSALKRMAKTASLEQNFEALRIFKKHKMYIQAGHILFDPETTIEELWENYFGMKEHIWTISKGIFSEMYAAEGTPFTRLLRRDEFQQSESTLGNHHYEILDPSARKIYSGLKSWHKSHMSIYDRAIDAISAPKALNEEELEQFQLLATRLREKDLDFMFVLLNAVEAGETDIGGLVEEEVGRARSWYEVFNQEVDQAYALSNLTYDADPNPFLE